VFDCFEEWGLTPELLREVSQHQVGLLAERFDALDADPEVITRDRSVALSEIGGFLALRSSRAAELSRRLRTGGVLTDYRDDLLRLGPAPYLAEAQLIESVELLGESVAALEAGSP
jgi:kynureninase